MKFWISWTLLAFLVVVTLTGCTVSQTQSGGGATATNKPQDSTVTESNNTNG